MSTPLLSAEPTNAALMGGHLLAVGDALCLKRCGWRPDPRVDIHEEAAGHLRDDGHPVLYHAPVPLVPDQRHGSLPAATAQ